LRADARIAAHESRAGDPTLTQIAARIEAAAALADRMRRQAPSPANAAIARSSASDASPTPLAERLAIVRALMEQDAGFRIFYTGTTGFDTHADQAFRHRRLLTELSDSLTGFLEDIGKSGLGERVVVLIFSEFGRRLRENGQQGTDHGAAAPVLLAGPSVTGGFLGGPPDLKNLDAGDVAFKVDYRDLYASLLRQWLDIDTAGILGARVTSLNVI
jgi:uncharacterized protein (DUF1501 family)